jgi:hypothetical protein
LAFSRITRRLYFSHDRSPSVKLPQCCIQKHSKNMHFFLTLNSTLQQCAACGPAAVATCLPMS